MLHKARSNAISFHWDKFPFPKLPPLQSTRTACAWLRFESPGRTEFEIVCCGNRAFSQNPALAEFLFGTGESVPVEARPYDDVRGVKRRMDDTQPQNPNNRAGQTLLGFALMETRDWLKTKME